MSLHTFKRSFTTASWLGWKVESNWADPFLFFVYSVIKPVAGAAIIVVMYSVITQGNFATPIFAYLFIGNAFYQYVGAVMTGVSWAIIDDREHYRTLKYIYVSPINVPMYLVGRGVARFVTGTFAVIVTMAFGIIFLQVPFDPATINWGLFALTLVVGVIMLTAMGISLAGVTLLTARVSVFPGDVVASLLYLFSGVIFPINMLPAWLQWIGYIMPTSYWLELIRRSLVGNIADAYPTFAALSNNQLMLILLGLTVIFGAISVFVFKACDHSARERGLIDWTSEY